MTQVSQMTSVFNLYSSASGHLIKGLTRSCNICNHNDSLERNNEISSSLNMISSK